MLRRNAVLQFAPGACVFPGGSVDDRDADRHGEWPGPARPRPTFAGRLGVSADRARALLCAAVRETFEESGVLLAGPSPATLVRPSAAMAADRLALLDGSLSLAGLLARRGLVLRADLLKPWARWITPEVSPAATTPGSSPRPCPPGRPPRWKGRRHPRSRRIGLGPWLRPARPWQRPGPGRSP